jgi:polysaccharide pyruvyl transferase WcaK-like protein
MDPSCWPDKNRPAYERYMTELSKFTINLVSSGHRVVVFPSAYEQDGPTVERLYTEVRDCIGDRTDDCLRFTSPGSVDDVIATIAGCELVVASRLHAVLLACLLARPTLALSYDPKVDLHRATEVSRQLSRRVDELRTELDRQYDWLAASLDRGRVSVRGEREIDEAGQP